MMIDHRQAAHPARLHRRPTTSDLRPQFEAEVGQWLADGKIAWRETVVDGIDNAVDAFP